MKCTVKFTINGESVEMEHDFDSTGPLVDNDILTVLKENPEKLLEIADLLWNGAVNFREIKKVSLRSLKSMDGLIGNCTVEFITNLPEFSGIRFLDTSANILLLDNFSLGKTNIKGRIINSQGKELFIVKHDKEDIQKLANFLNTRKHLQESEILINPNSTYKELMDLIIEKRNKKADPVSNYSELMLDFIYNRSNYKGIFIDGNSAISILTLIWYDIKDWALSVSYNDKFINDLSLLLISMLDVKNGKTINRGDYSISFDNLYNLLVAHYPDLLTNLKLKSVKDLRNFFLKSIESLTEDEIRELKKIGTITNSIPATILHPLFEKEPDFTFQFKKISNTNNSIILHHEYENLHSKYGIGYDTIASMDIIEDDYRGYKIYKLHIDDKDRYFVSRGYLTELNQSRTFNSKEEAVNFINNSLRFLALGKNSLMEFKFQNGTIDATGTIIYENSIDLNSIKTGTSYVEGLIIEVLDIPIKNNTQLLAEEVKLLSGRLSDFEEYINTWKIDESIKNDIIKSMNTPEKAVTFLYKVAELLGVDRTNSKRIKEILEQISTTGKKYYFIDKKEIRNKSFIYRVIPTTPDDLVEYKKAGGKNTPVVTWMNAMKTALENLFKGVTINLYTSKEIKELNIPYVDPSTDKAFIYNGQVYVNTTIAKSDDLLHEYIHIILGCIKTNPDLVSNYESLMRYVAESETGSKLLEDLRLAYPDISEMDLMEEVFASMFSNYVRGRITPGNKIFDATEKEIKTITESVFDTKIGDIREFYGKSVLAVFNKFYKEIAKLLQDNEINYDEIGLGRKYSNYISQLIKENKILEEC